MTEHPDVALPEAMIKAAMRAIGQIQYPLGGWQAANQLHLRRKAEAALAAALVPRSRSAEVEAYDQYYVGDHRCCQLEAGSEDFVHLRPERRHTHFRRVTYWSDGSEWRSALVPVTPAEPPVDPTAEQP